ncbi:MAG: S49 family peptidase [Methylococcaceae bacterium]|nr:MAG: S49 family peptidase [Methylococcaceae bacterium]
MKAAAFSRNDSGFLRRTAMDFIMLGEPWAITREAMDTIISVAKRDNQDPEALALRLGRPLENTRDVTLHGSVAVVPLSGPIFPKANLFTEISGATSLEQFMQDIAAADANPAVSHIVIDIHSPGGQTTGVHEAMTMIRGLSKPTTAYVSGQAASAAYLLASGAQRIVLDPMALVGSIGVVLSIPPKSESAPLEIVSSQSPDKRPDHGTEPGRAVYQTLVDDLAAVFIGAIADNRGKTPEQIAGARGGMLVGQKAVDFGLADALGSLDAVISSIQATQSTTPYPMGRKTMTTPTDQVYTAADLEKARETAHATGKTAGHAEGVAAEKARMAAIFALPEAQGREATAQTMALETDMSAEQIGKVLASLPAATPPPSGKTGVSEFEKHMQAIGNPKVGADTDNDDGDATAMKNIHSVMASIGLLRAPTTVQ